MSRTNDAACSLAQRAGPLLLALLLLGLWLLAAVLLVGKPEHVFVSDVIVDDAIYFAAPARHLLDGYGYSFDKLEPSNGVQALWALVTLLLATLFEDRLLLLRAMALVSGLCWLASAGVLFGTMRAHSRSAAWIGFCGLAAAGLSQRLAFQGMENGLHALLSALVLGSGLRWVRRGYSRAATLELGVLLALFAMSRTEGVLLALVIGAARCFGLLRVRGSSGQVEAWSGRLRSCLLLALPGVLLVGGLLIFSRIYFGLWTPISGEVKTFYESAWGREAPHGPLLENLRWHLKFVRNLALAPLVTDLRTALSEEFGSSSLGSLSKRLLWIGISLGCVAAAWRWGRLRFRLSGVAVFGLLFGLHALLHLMLMGALLPHFTSYGTWYFAQESLVIWAAVALLLTTAARALGAGAAKFEQKFCWPKSLRYVQVLTLGLVFAGILGGALAGQLRSLREDPRTSRFLEAGEWLEENVPAGTVAGALSSGLVAWYAPSLHVINLDGLINTRSYLDEVLRKGRLAEYFAEKQIEWFADYQPLSVWQNGIQWCGVIPRSRLVPREYWRLGEDHSYVIWQVLAEGARFTVLEDTPLGLRRNRRAELLVAADVDGRFALAADEELGARLAADPGLVVAASFAQEPEMLLHHVLVPQEQLEQLGMQRANVQPQTPLDLELADGLRLVGCEILPRNPAPGRRIIVTLYWLCEQAPSGGGWQLLLVGESGVRHGAVTVGHQHGSRPMTQWKPGELVSETVALTLPQSWEGAPPCLILRREGATSWSLGALEKR
jgi:hypothetical protein